MADMVIYLALTFWLMVALLEAFAIFKLFEGLVRPRWINLVLLPGMVVAELAYFLAGLLTGASVREAKLVSDEAVGQPAQQPANGIPILSPLLMALLPILSGLALIVTLYKCFDARLVDEFGGVWSRASDQLTQQLGWSLGAWFAIARDMLSLAERLVNALPVVRHWQAALFLYLTLSLAVRIVPLRGNLRSAMASIILIGGIAALVSLAAPRMTAWVRGEWTLLAYVIALLTLTLIIALLVRGLVGLVATVIGRGGGKRTASAKAA